MSEWFFIDHFCSTSVRRYPHQSAGGGISIQGSYVIPWSEVTIFMELMKGVHVTPSPSCVVIQSRCNRVRPHIGRASSAIRSAYGSLDPKRMARYCHRHRNGISNCQRSLPVFTGGDRSTGLGDSQTPKHSPVSRGITQKLN